METNDCVVPDNELFRRTRQVLADASYEVEQLVGDLIRKKRAEAYFARIEYLTRFGGSVEDTIRIFPLPNVSADEELEFRREQEAKGAK